MSDTTTAVAYRNTATDEVHVLPAARDDLDARPNFTRIPLDTVPAAAVEAALRAAAERASVEAAHANRLDKAARAIRPPRTVDRQTPPAATYAHMTPTATNPGDNGVINRGAVPGMTPEQAAERDAAEREARDDRGVLTRAADGNQGDASKPAEPEAPPAPAKAPKATKAAAPKTAR